MVAYWQAQCLAQEHFDTWTEEARDGTTYKMAKCSFLWVTAACVKPTYPWLTCAMLFVTATHPTSLPPPSSSFIPLPSLPHIHSSLSIHPILSFPTYPPPFLLHASGIPSGVIKYLTSERRIPNIRVIFFLRFHMTNLVQQPPCFTHPHGHLSSLCIYSSSTPECYHLHEIIKWHISLPVNKSTLYILQEVLLLCPAGQTVSECVWLAVFRGVLEMIHYTTCQARSTQKWKICVFISHLITQ